MARQRIPVVLVAGFLGSGKTTMLNHLLANRQGARVGVVVNDFGSVNIDALAVSGQVDTMVSLGNGCLCCAVDASGLDAMLGKLAGAEAGIDVIVVEASGIAEPRDLLRLMIASENPDIRYGGLAEVVDVAEFAATRERHPELADHLRIADLVVVNKADRVAAGEVSKVTATVEELAPGVPVLVTDHGRVDPELFFDPKPREAYGQLSFDDLREDDHSHHLHAAYQSITFTSERPLSPRKLLAFLEQRPAGLYRVKGHVDLGANGPRSRFGLHTVGSFVQLERSSWPAGQPRGTQLVLIGAGLGADDVTRRLTECVSDDDTVDERGLLRILRYLDEPVADQEERPPGD
ncbi:GTP-binding protein [Amycolatopsis sp. FDAARGOS 1241]|uniref:CobW family GTP-binding protein n=1 Tax=Amycolatopsis sp. FDAARGOS 1241 TaxID=2778070 RepID=UPI0019512332|nr:GTP-binding protein [Amycolatopsis sp. FDAARGOS 1241]QRP43632.1 GTP-binding protein [Amycolatopsis sp. FDAARGOS 1241]